jgi:chromosome segregation ATPase
VLFFRVTLKNSPIFSNKMFASIHSHDGSAYNPVQWESSQLYECFIAEREERERQERRANRRSRKLQRRNQRVVELEGEINELERETDQLKYTTEAQHHTINELVTQVESLADDCSGARATCRYYQDEADCISLERDEFATQVRLLKVQSSWLESNLTDLEEKYDKLQVHVNDSEKECNILQTQVNDLVDECDDLEAQVNDSEKECIDLQTEVNDLADGCGNLQAQVNDLANDNDAMCNENDVMIIKIADMEKELSLYVNLEDVDDACDSSVVESDDETCARSTYRSESESESESDLSQADQNLGTPMKCRNLRAEYVSDYESESESENKSMDGGKLIFVTQSSDEDL